MITSLFFWYIALCAVIFTLAMISFIRLTALRILLSTLLFMGSLAISYVGLFSLSGLPQPVWLMTLPPDVEEAEVLGGFVQEDVGIFVLLSAPGLGIPRYYWFAYSQKAAEQFQKAQERAKKRAQKGIPGEMRMGKPFEKSLQDRQDEIFHDPPQEKRPDKDEPTDQVIRVPQQH